MTVEISAGEKYDGNAEARETFIARMVAEGFKVVLPADNELFVDIDSDAQYLLLARALDSLRRNGIPVDDPIDRPSRSGYPHRHVVVTLPFDVTPWQRIAWQAALGSDPMRELLSAVRLRRGDVHPTLFVENA